MPNQNDPTQNPNPVNQTAAPPVPPVIFPQSDLPPLPPEFSAIGGSGSAEQKVPSVDAPTFPIDQPASQLISNDASSSAPPDISSVIPKAKKKFGGGRIIATILGILVLVGGVGAGLILTKQQQIFQPKAVDCGTVNCVSPRGVCCNTGCFPDGTTCAPDNIPISNPPTNPPNSTSGPTVDCGTQTCYTDTQVCCNTGCKSKSSGCEPGDEPQGTIRCSSDSSSVAVCRGEFPGYESCIGGGEWKCGPGPNCKLFENPSGNACHPGGAVNCVTPTNPCGGGGNCRKWVCPQGDTNGDGKCQTGDTGASYTDYTDCSGISCGSACCQIDWLYSAGNYCDYVLNCKEIKLSCSPPTAPPTAPPTVPPTAPPTVPPTAPSCITVKAYDSTWTFIPKTQLPSLAVDTTINFCVNGSAPSGTFDKAQFKIGTTLKPETVTKRPSSTDFCETYTILSTDTTINVKAKVHHSTGVWVGESI